MLCVTLPQLMQQYENISELQSSVDYNSWSRPGIDHLQILKSLKSSLSQKTMDDLAELVAKCRIAERESGETKIWRDYGSKAL